MKRTGTASAQEEQHEPAESPSAMGDKMMGPAMRCGGPTEMMQKMMAQMSRGQGQAKMEKMISMCMGMCSEMMTSMRQTNALAVHVTPELQRVFGEWLKQLENQALDRLAKGAADATGLARSLNITEDSALYILHRLAVS